MLITRYYLRSTPRMYLKLPSLWITNLCPEVTDESLHSYMRAWCCLYIIYYNHNKLRLSGSIGGTAEPSWELVPVWSPTMSLLTDSLIVPVNHRLRDTSIALGHRRWTLSSSSSWEILSILRRLGLIVRAISCTFPERNRLNQNCAIVNCCSARNLKRCPPFQQARFNFSLYERKKILNVRNFVFVGSHI